MMEEQSKRLLVEILLIEDNPTDVLLMQVAMKECKIVNRLHVSNDSEAALSLLRRQGEHVDAARPDLVLLDLDLPKMDGRALLREMKSDPSLRTIPVVVLTMSDAETDVAHSYDLQANAYITKPLDMGQFIRVVKGIDDFWFGIVRLPGQTEAE
jgi:two-component system, chemotaxis family, response regulator Rcp1